VNLSLGDSAGSPDLQSAVSYALSKGKLLVAAVGNDGDKGNPVEYPAAYPGVVGVSAIDQSSTVASLSEHGPQVALSAPGVNMVEACTYSSGYCTSQGTSNSAALVSASAALVWAVHRDWTANQVLRVLMNTAGKPDNGNYSQYLGYGIVRPRIALATPGDPGPADVNPLLAANSSAAPSASASATAPAATPSTGTGAVVPKKSAGGGVWLWVGVGIVGVVLLGGAAAAAVLRGRRRNAGQGPGQVPPSPGVYGQPPYGAAGPQPWAQQPPHYPQPQQPPYPPQQAPYPPPGYGTGGDDPSGAGSSRH
jgi:hypothetical protein